MDKEIKVQIEKALAEIKNLELQTDGSGQVVNHYWVVGQNEYYLGNWEPWKDSDKALDLLENFTGDATIIYNDDPHETLDYDQVYDVSINDINGGFGTHSSLAKAIIISILDHFQEQKLANYLRPDNV